MGHLTPKSYYDLQQRLDKSPQGVPASDALFKILEILFTEKEAALVSVLPINFFPVSKAAKIWKIDLAESERILDGLADKGLLIDIPGQKEKSYALAPPMAGFFEFSLMRSDGKFDRKILSELFHQYINVEEDFANKSLGFEPMIVRTFVQEESLNPEQKLEILDYEKSRKVIDNATCITVGTCYCRHKMEHLGKACDAPQEVCLSFNNAARSLANHGIAKEISKQEAHKILDEVINLGLVQIGDNVQDSVGFICNCCGCCCEALLVYKRLGYNPKIHSNYFAQLNHDKCIGCGLCAKKCPVDAIDLTKNDCVDFKRCIGCGVCTRFCSPKAITLKRRKDTAFVPKDVFERFVICAINTSKLQNLIFDNYHLWTYDLLRNLIGIILKLSPVKRTLANSQLRSRYLAKIIKLYSKGKHDYSHPELKQ